MSLIQKKTSSFHSNCLLATTFMKTASLSKTFSVWQAAVNQMSAGCSDVRKNTHHEHPVSPMCVCNVCGIRLSACGNSTLALAHNLNGGLHVCECVCVFAARILLSDCRLQSWHTCTHKLSYKCVAQTFGTSNIYLFSDVTGVQLMLFF